ncbi:MAG: murein hydrolase activator EnvC [Acidobacteriota bacterium]
MGAKRFCWHRAMVHFIKRCGVLLFLLTLVPALLMGQENNFQRVEEEKKKLEELREKIREVKTKISRYERDERGILKELEEMDLQLKLKDLEVQELASEQQIKQKEIEKTTLRIEALEKEIDSLRAYISQMLINLYKLGRLSYLRVLLSLQSSADFLRGYKYIAILSERDRQKLHQFKMNVLELQQSQHKLEEDTLRVKNLKQAAENKRGEIKATRKRKEQLLTNIRQQRELELATLQELQESSARLERLITELIRQREAALSPGVGLSLNLLRGQLDWPVASEVTVPFGSIKHPRFHTYTPHNGVDFSAPEGMPVTAIYDGVVIYADWFRGYGNLLIIDHGYRYWSLHAHLSQFTVKVGERVRKGDLIGMVGETGSLKGPYLYFEIRHKGKPLDPLKWLKNKP